MPKFELKQLGTKNVLYVIAANQEYGPSLQKLFVPLFVGIGPVEAAVNMTDALAGLAAQDCLPDYVVSLGSAGSAVLEQTEIYQITSVSYRDMDASPLGFEKGETPLLDLPIEVTLPLAIDGIKSARLSTGANVISGGQYSSINADMVDMETFAILRACMKYDVPLIGLRGVSDGKEELHKFEDWTQFLGVIDAKLASAVQLIEKNIVQSA